MRRVAGGHEVDPPVLDMDMPGPPPPPPAAGGRTHLVVPSDTLTAISARYYGGKGGEARIHAANRHLIGPRAEDIYPGLILSIPY
jgi:nucleoid-associated protein YgaU